MNIDGEVLDQFNDFIIQIIDERIQKALNKLKNSTETYRHVKVIDIQNETASTETQKVNVISATVQDMTTKEIIENVPNKSGDVLTVGDIVRLYETNGNYHSQYIGLKCGKE